MHILYLVGNNVLEDNLSAGLSDYVALNLAHTLPIRRETMAVLPSAEQQSAFKPIVQLLHWR